MIRVSHPSWWIAAGVLLWLLFRKKHAPLVASPESHPYKGKPLPGDLYTAPPPPATVAAGDEEDPGLVPAPRLPPETGDAGFAGGGGGDSGGGGAGRTV